MYIYIYIYIFILCMDFLLPGPGFVNAEPDLFRANLK